MYVYVYVYIFFSDIERKVGDHLLCSLQFSSLFSPMASI